MTLSHYPGEIRRDLIYALRTLAKSPGFAAVAIVSLGLGIGVTTAVYSELNALLFRDLPAARDPQQLALASGVSYPYFEQYRDQPALFASAGALIQAVPFAVSLEGAPGAQSERVFGQIVSPEYFSVFGVEAAHGRLFSPAMDKPGEPPLVIVSERFWRTRLHADPGAVGRILRLNGQSATVAGVAPKDFLGNIPVIPADLFVPVTAPASLAPELGGGVLQRREAKPFSVVFRLAPGVSIGTAETALDSITRRLDQSSLDADRDRKGRRVHLTPAGTVIPLDPRLRPVIFGLYGTLLGLILTIACMNLANMLLARAGARRREIAIRLAVGASRFRLIRQLVIESLTLALGGGIAGFLFGDWITHLASHLRLPIAIPFEIDIRPDWRVALFTLALSMAAGLGFGLFPAFEATRAEVAPTLREGSAFRMRGHRRFGLRNLLVVYQVAGSLALLLITGFLVMGYNRGSTADLHFNPATMLLFSLDPVRDGYSPERAAAFFEKLPERLRNVGAVENVALASAAPYGINFAAADFVGGADMENLARTLRAAVRESVGPGYFAALNIRPIAGREFSDYDARVDPSGGVALPAILSDSAAREMFNGQSAVGRRVEQQSRSYQVVGVVPDLGAGLFAGGSTSVVYVPLSRSDLSHPPPGGMTLMVRAAGGADAVQGVRREIAAIDPGLSVFNARTLAQSLDDNNAALRIGTVLYGGMGIFGLVLASLGLAGVTAYSVAQRRKEIGIRMALGARKGQVLRLVMREGSALVAIGCLLGFGAAMALARALSAILNVFAQVFQIAANDPRLLVGAPLLLAALAMAACYLPARKSTQIDPLIALREE